MLKFDANLSQLYLEHPFLERFGAAAADGFQGVEYRGPYDYPKQQIADLLRQHSLTQVLFNCPAGDWDAGERGIACIPGREGEFREGIELALDYALALGCTRLNCLAGSTPRDHDTATIEATLVENLQLAAQRFGEHGIKLQLEALNTRDTPAAFVTTTAHWERIAEKVGSPNLYLQYDFYHMQVMQGDIVRSFTRLQPKISHVQIADNPGRHEPGTGEINYGFVFTELERLNYDGWIGCEYIPAGKTSDGLGWLRELRS
jgi:hydroxypyruvate isomerase